MQARAGSVVGRLGLLASAVITLLWAGGAAAAPDPPSPASPSGAESIPVEVVVAVGLPPVPPTTAEVVAVGLPPVPPTTAEVVAVGLPPVPPTTAEVVAVGLPPVPPTTAEHHAVAARTPGPGADAAPGSSERPAPATQAAVDDELDPELAARQVTSLVIDAATRAALALRR